MNNGETVLRLDALQIFCRVAELSSFSGAAQSLGLPKATVSVAIRDLEAALGVQLFHRTTRRVQTTHDGEAFYERCKDFLSDADELASMFETGAVRGRIRVDAPANMALTLILDRLPELLKRNPDLQVELSGADRRVDVVGEGFDCVIRVGARADSGLIARPLGRFDIVNCASPGYLAAYGTPRTPEDLAAHVAVGYAPQLGAPPEDFEYWDGETYRSVKMPWSLTVNNSQTYMAAAASGLGIIQVPRLGVSGFLDSGALIEILPDYRAEPMPVAIIYPHRRNLAKRVRVFIDWAAEIFEAAAEKGVMLPV
jgi:DNA-binding transcriptional LysR family regulator